MVIELLPLSLVASVMVGSWREKSLRYYFQTELEGFPLQSSLLGGKSVKGRHNNIVKLDLTCTGLDLD